MMGIVQYKDGDIDTVVGSGSGQKMVASILKNWMWACQDDKRNLEHPPEKIWIVMDELGEEFDENAEPAWAGPARVQTAAIFSPKAGDEDLGIVVSCVVRENEDWLDALKLHYPETWNAIVSIRGMYEHCEISDWLDITIPSDRDAAEYVYTGVWAE